MTQKIKYKTKKKLYSQDELWDTFLLVQIDVSAAL
jgi:hypothetical protein